MKNMPEIAAPVMKRGFILKAPTSEMYLIILVRGWKGIQGARK
jgi:hypothetical protein